MRWLLLPTTRGSAPLCKVYGIVSAEPDRFYHTHSAGSAGSRYIKRRSMIDRRSEEGHSAGYRYSSLKIKRFCSYMPLIVVEGQHTVKFSLQCQMKNRVSADRPTDVISFRAQFPYRRFDIGYFLRTEQSVFAAMGI